MSGFYAETVQIVPSISGYPLSVNVWSAPGVNIEVNVSSGSWIKDDPINGYFVKINWEGCVSLVKNDDWTIQLESDTILYESQGDSIIRFRGVSILAGKNDSTYTPIFDIRGDSTYTSGAQTYLEDCVIKTEGDFRYIIYIKSSTTPPIRTSTDIRNCRISWAIPGFDGISYPAIFIDDVYNQKLEIRNSYIWDQSGTGSDTPIYTTGDRNFITIDDVQFFSSTYNQIGSATIYSVASAQKIYIGSRCISTFEIPVNCTNPLFGTLDCNLTTPMPVII